jgi:uncharacterized protein YuzE
MAKVVTPRLNLKEILKAVPHIVKFPTTTMWCDYDQEADVLYISFERPQDATNSVMLDNGILVHYRKAKVVGVTILEASTR